MNNSVINKKASKVRNKNLTAAKKAKDDEFYTRREDVENELHHYDAQFKEKIILLNCDDTETSEFFFYFTKKFEYLNLKRLIAVHYTGNGPSYILDIIPELIDYQGVYDLSEIKKPIIGNGDFRSDECIELLKRADIVVTNPPFSLIEEYIAQLIYYDKQFLIIGSETFLHYNCVFPFLKDNKMWLGYTKPKEFMRPNKSFEKFGNMCWYTNLETIKRHEKITLFQKYDPSKYPKYDNADVIYVDTVVNIPIDYYDVMGVPITFLSKYSPEQFKILGRDRDLTIDKKEGFINGKGKFTRIFIQRI